MYSYGQNRFNRTLTYIYIYICIYRDLLHTQVIVDSFRLHVDLASTSGFTQTSLRMYLLHSHLI